LLSSQGDGERLHYCQFNELAKSDVSAFVSKKKRIMKAGYSESRGMTVNKCY
jgi:hypothetical protein